MKRLISIILVVAIVVCGAYIVPRLIHKCDDCGQVFFGTGYYANVVAEYFAGAEQIICKSCAEKQHAVAIALGQSVEEFKRGLFD